MDSLIFIAYFNAVARIRNARIWVCDARRHGFIQIWATREINDCGIKRHVTAYKSYAAGEFWGRSPLPDSPNIKKLMIEAGRQSAELSGVLDNHELIKSYD